MLPLGAIIPLAGLGGAALGMPVGQIFDTPRKWAWNHLFGTDDGEVLARRLMAGLGMMPQQADAESAEQSPMTQAMGMGLEMALDPFTILGSLGGGALGTKMFQRAQKAASISPLQQALGHVDDMEGVVGRYLPRQAGSLTIAPTSMTQSSYIPEILDELPDVMKLGRAGKTYSKVAPDAAELTQRLGLGAPSGSGLSVMQPPSFLEGRGGKMFLTKNAPSHLQYEDILTGIPDNTGRTLGELVGSSDAGAYREVMPWARGPNPGRKFKSNAFSFTDEFTGPHLMDMTADEVPAAMSDLRRALQGQLSKTNAELAGRSPFGATVDLGRELFRLAGANRPSVTLPPF